MCQFAVPHFKSWYKRMSFFLCLSQTPLTFSCFQNFFYMQPIIKFCDQYIKLLLPIHLSAGIYCCPQHLSITQHQNLVNHFYP